MTVRRMIDRYGRHVPYVIIGIVAILAFVLNPSITGIAYALIVIVGACTVWLLRVLYLNEVERQRREE
jgi:Ca2+/Na+ antiporter